MDYKQGAFLCALLQAFFYQPVSMRWSFSVPCEITALEGSCVVIPCTFNGSILKWDRQRLTFTWCLWRSGKHDYPEVYNSKDSTNVLPKYQGRALLVGDLLDHNCTLQINNVTGEDADKYYPLIEWKYDPTVSVKVSDTPAQPTVTYPRAMTEGVPVILTCSVGHTCPAHPPTLAWDKISSNVSVYHEELWDGRWRTVLQLIYTPAAEHHKEEFVCSATYPGGKSASKSITLSIRYAPKGVDAVLSEDPEEGKPMELLCATNSSNPRETYFTWYKNEDVIQEQEGNMLRIESTAMDNAGIYHCVAHNAIGSTSSAPVTVYLKSSSAPSNVVLLIGLLVAVLAAAAIGAILMTRRHLNNKKKKNVNISNQFTQLSHNDEGQKLSQNVDSVYAALDGSQAASEYEEIRRNERREKTPADD